MASLTILRKKKKIEFPNSELLDFDDVPGGGLILKVLNDKKVTYYSLY